MRKMDRRASAQTKRQCTELCNHILHHSDQGVQYLSIRYTASAWRMAIFNPRSAAFDCSYDNALAEAVMGFFKPEVIEHDGLRRGLKRASWPRLTESTGSITAGRSSRSATYRRPWRKPTFMRRLRSLLKQHDSNPRVSTEAGAIHL